MKTVLIFILSFFFLFPGLKAQLRSNPGTSFSSAVGAGARAFGMGGAFIAVADDATAASWNPGGLGQLEKPEFSLVIKAAAYNRVFPASDTSGKFLGSVSSNTLSGNIDFFSFTYPIRFGNIKIVPQFSYQRVVSYDIDYIAENRKIIQPLFDPVSGEHLTSLEGTINDRDSFQGGIDSYSFSLATVLFNRLHLGVSLNYMTNGYKGETTTRINGLFSPPVPGFPETYESYVIDTQTVRFRGLNFNAGLLVQLSKRWKLGMVFKTSFRGNIEFEETEDQQSNLSPSDTAHFQGEDTFKLDWPRTWGVGLAYNPIDPLTLSLDFTHTAWSKSILHPGNAGILEEDHYFPSLNPVSDPDHLHQIDTMQWRLGAEYVLIGEKILIPLRFGLFSDSQFFSTENGEPVIYSGITFGAGFKKGRIAVDVAVLAESGKYIQSRDDFSQTEFKEVRIYTSFIYAW